MSKMYIKDSSGNKSLTATMAFISFIVVMLKVLFSGAVIVIGSFSYDFGTIDALTIGAVFGPILGSYTARRWGDPPRAPAKPTVTTGPGSKSKDGAE